MTEQSQNPEQSTSEPPKADSNSGSEPSKPEKQPTIEQKPLTDNEILLKLLIVTGNSFTFRFTLKNSAASISDHVWSNWPEGWPETQRPERSETLRLIYQGRFLHGNVTMGALKLQSKNQTVMHLVHRERLPQANAEADKENKSGQSGSTQATETCPSVMRAVRRCCCFQ